MEQGVRYEKDYLSKKERTTCIGNGNSGENPNRFNVKRTRRKEITSVLKAILPCVFFVKPNHLSRVAR
jgi:hypothetical protein